MSWNRTEGYFEDIGLGEPEEESLLGLWHNRVIGIAAAISAVTGLTLWLNEYVPLLAVAHYLLRA